MTSKQQKAIELLVSGDFNTYEEIAEHVKVSRKTLYNWRREEKFTKELSKEINLKLTRIVPKALNKIERLIDSDNEHIALMAAKNILDRAGYKAVDKLKLDSNIETNQTTGVAFIGMLEEWSE